LIRLHQEVRQNAATFDEVRYQHVPREQNRDADRMANVGVDEWLAGRGRDWRPPAPHPGLF